MTRVESKCFSHEEMKMGCPLNNLANEMAPIDERFRLLVEEIFQNWRNAFAQALRTSQENGYIRPEVPVDKVSAFLVSALEGGASQIKNSMDENLMRNILDMTADYLKSLRSQPVEVS